jgi:translation initiation factor IF-1
MKKFALLLSLALVAGAASADEKVAASDKDSKSHKTTATVVSTDTAKNTITIKGEDGAEKTAPVEGKALASLKTVKAGDKVTVTCRDDAAGAHQAVTEIAPAKAEVKAPEAPKS